jgi:hypothetical protein
MIIIICFNSSFTYIRTQQPKGQAYNKDEQKKGTK